MGSVSGRLMHRSLRVGPEDREGRILVNRVTRLDVLQDVTHPTPGPEPPERLERGMSECWLGA